MAADSVVLLPCRQPEAAEPPLPAPPQLPKREKIQWQVEPAAPASPGQRRERSEKREEARVDLRGDRKRQRGEQDVAWPSEHDRRRPLRVRFCSHVNVGAYTR